MDKNKRVWDKLKVSERVYGAMWNKKIKKIDDWNKNMTYGLSTCLPQSTELLYA